MDQDSLNMPTAPGSPAPTDIIPADQALASVKVLSANGKRKRWMLPCGEKSIEAKREDSPEAGAGAGFVEPPELRLNDEQGGEVKKRQDKPPMAPRCKRTARVMSLVQPAAAGERAASPLPMFERELLVWQEPPAAEDTEAMLGVGPCVREPVQRELDLQTCCVFDGVPLEPITQLGLEERMLDF
jgi:hypothetical protein